MDNKELEIGKEKQRLQDVENIIKEETLNYIYKRKVISEAIIKYRKQALEEFKDDEDQVAEYFDHERYINEEAFRLIDKKLKELAALRENPYFAKVVIDETGEEEQLYIGRFGLNRDEDLHPIIVDWRAPIAAVFYAGKLGRVSYNAPKGPVSLEVLQKRQFIIKKGNLEGMFDSSSEIKDEILQMVLSKNAGEKLKDIIMTIQAEQDKLIRYDRTKTIVINGVAGSGKTTVALHRVAYLMYNYRNILENKVLVIGPNNIFLDYISSVLPSLGESGIRQTTFLEFAQAIIKDVDILPFKESMEKLINGDDEYRREFEYKESFEFLEALEHLALDLEKHHFKTSDVSFYDSIIVTREEIEKMFLEYFKDMPLFRRSIKIKRIILSKIKDESYRLVNEINRKHRDKINSLSEGDRALEENHLEFIRKLNIKEVIREAVRVKRDLHWLDNPSITDIYNKFNQCKRLTFEDLSPILYLYIKLSGFKLNYEVKHIVIDEAQDFSRMQFMVLKEITGCKSFTVAGDINQRIIPSAESIPMMGIHEIYKDCDVEYFDLKTSYRSTTQIMKYSSRFLSSTDIVPLAREGTEVLEKEFTSIQELNDCIIMKIMEYKNKGYESIAVICKTISEAVIIGNGIKEKMHINIFNSEDYMYKGGEVVIPSYYAKGMEFDCVINVFAAGKQETYDENKLKYVMATRALHEMCWYQLTLGGDTNV